MLIKTLAGMAVFAAIGAAVGYSKILCAGGECAITGTPYGGAFFGGMIGLVVMNGINASPLQAPAGESPDAPEEETDRNEP